MRTDWYKRNGSRGEVPQRRRDRPALARARRPRRSNTSSSKGVDRLGHRRCIGTDAGAAGGMEPPFPAHNLMHKANRYGLASLCQPRQAAAQGRDPDRRAAEDRATAPAARSARWRWCRRVRPERPGRRVSPSRGRRPTTSSSAAASTRWSARRCSPARAQQGAGAGAQRPHRRLHPHRGDHRAGLRPRRDGDDLRAVHHLAGLCRAGRRPRRATGWSSATRPRRPACCARTAAHARADAWTAPPTSPRSNALAPATATAMRARCRRASSATPACCSACSAAGCGAARRCKLLAGEAWRRGPARAGRLLRRGAGCRRAAGSKPRYESELSRALLGAVGAACRARPGGRLFRPDRQGHRLRARGRRRADRQGRRGQAARRLRGADPRARRRRSAPAPTLPRSIETDGRATGVRLASGETDRREARASSARSRRRSSTAGCSATTHRSRRREAARKYRYGKGNFQIHYALDRAARLARRRRSARWRCCT